MKASMMLKFFFLVFATLGVASCGQVDRNLENEAARIEESAQTQQPKKESGLQIYCPAVYRPVCGQPPMPVCPEGHSCIQVMPEVRTYSNSCELSREGAELLYEGECQKSAH